MRRNNAARQNTQEVAVSESEAVVPGENHHWEQAQEEEWLEHAATTWALAHIIHRIYSTPFPPELLPEQREHLQTTLKKAAALIEDWQEREREQAQRLAAQRPPPVYDYDEETDDEKALIQFVQNYYKA